jgi:ABC-type sugar transport system permease subunit
MQSSQSSGEQAADRMAGSRFLRGKAGREMRWGLIFISPGIIFFLVFWITPIIITLSQSFWRWRAGRPSDYIGLKNYGDLLGDPLFLNSARASAGITFGALVVGMLTAFVLALLLNDSTLRGRRWFRLIIFLPVVTDWVATGLVWQLIFLPHQGVLPALFHSLGLGQTVLPTLKWTATRDLAPIAVVIFIIWKTTGLYTVILLAGLQSVPTDLIEAARSDGANGSQVIRHIILPLLAPITVFVVMIGFVSAIGLFEPVFMLTGGGPAEATKTLPLFIHETFFRFRDEGYGSAAAVLFLFITLAFAVIATRYIRSRAYEE